VAGKRSRTARDARRRTLGQNFLRNRGLAVRLVRDARISGDDLVVELAAGTGILTGELARRADRVVAVELDPEWARRLLDSFAAVENVLVAQGDALRFPLPGEPFRVVANLPFGRTTAFLRHLLDDPESALVAADLIVQHEVARKRARNRGTLLTLSWAPWFEFSLGRRIPASAFRPIPAVDAAVLRVRRRAEPLLEPAERSAFAAFLEDAFAALPSDLAVEDWIALYRRR
jgi:23S rRNA (adenine-N6)-dimethyltransferase